MISRGDIGIALLFVTGLVLGKAAMADDAAKPADDKDKDKPINNAKPEKKK
jgi:hypothetical protein